MFCPQCGSDNQETVSYCNRCGANLGAVRNALARLSGTSPEVKIHLSLQQILRAGWWTSVVGFLVGLMTLLLANSLPWPVRAIVVILSFVIFAVSYVVSSASCLITLRKLEPLMKDAPLKSDERATRELPNEQVETSFLPSYGNFNAPPSVSEGTTRSLSESARPLAANQQEE